MAKNRKTKNQQHISEAELGRIEFFRNGFARMPDIADKSPGIAYLVTNEKNKPTHRFCTCTVSNRKTCSHILKLVQAYKALNTRLNGGSLAEDFTSSIWHRLALIMTEGSPEKAQSVCIRSVDLSPAQARPGSREDGASDRFLRVFDSKENAMLFYLSQGADCIRFVERCGKTPEEDAVPSRSSVLNRLALLTLTENERAMNDRGFKTRRQVMEESFWFRLAYHGYREFGASGCTFHPAVEETTGKFSIMCKVLAEEADGHPVFRMIIPRNKVKRLINSFREFLPNQHNLAIHPIPLKSIFKVSTGTELDLEVRPLIRLIQEDGETRFLEREDMERFRYGDLVYVKELGLLAELEQPGKMERKFKAPVRMVLKKSQVPSFLEEFRDDLLEGSHLVDADVKALKIFKQFDRVEISPDALDRDWCWLSVKYGFGNASISLSEILRAKEEGQRYINAQGGWIDCTSPILDGLDSIPNRHSGNENTTRTDSTRLSRMELLRLNATTPGTLDVTGDERIVNQLKRMFDLQPMEPLPELKGVVSTLRPYQKLGVEWIRFLFENGLGGLLCDDMGLGKTHEVMHFMVGLREQEKVEKPFLVVCPTTVLGHWNAKIREHAPVLKTALYYGNQRDLEEAFKECHVLLTSYGLLRNDIEKLKEISFSVAVFDEVQNIKNPQTQAYGSARQIRAHMKLGLTGTPIENSLIELKALLDLTLPGYLGADKDFESRYLKPIELDPKSPRREELSRLIAPFTLRRRKETVLDDLPEKIEDIWTCRLSDDQMKLYQDAIALKGKGLINTLKDSGEPVPYIHIFALLNLLKQICNHPAMVEGIVDEYGQYDSGKWELFKELLSECIGSGQKVVVYSQFLGMINIMEKFLKEQEVDFVTLTGASRRREEIISRFNNDPDCRVYLGSLKAGGVGIDLVAASVVIHYDRWWNAAREDQATDRVHRIGQRRGVQVFKLVTEGTLEEKISAIIEKKRDLMEGIVKENDPGILKALSREELIDLLTIP